MKIIYDFTLNKEEEVEETLVSKGDQGEEIKTIKKVKKDVPKQFSLKKPGRKLYDEAELFYGVKLSEGIKAGLLTRALLAKRFNNDGGVLSENEKDRFTKLYMGLFEKQARFQELDFKGKSVSPEEKKERSELLSTLNRARQELQEFEMAQASLFDQTAENRARNKTILWWVVQLSHRKVGEDKYEPVFGDGEYDNKIKVYDELEEKGDEFVEEMLTKLSYYVSFWYITKPETREELETLLKTADETPEQKQEAEEVKAQELAKAAPPEDVKELVEKEDVGKLELQT